jgi:hypothetical protein
MRRKLVAGMIATMQFTTGESAGRHAEGRFLLGTLVG